MPSRRRPTPTVVTSGLLALMAGFQGALALGAPWGRAAYGGRHPGRLPTGYRLTSGIAAAGYAGAAAGLLAGMGTPTTRRRSLTVAAAFTGVGVLVNVASPSPPERLLWTPVCLLTATTAWRARRDQ